MEISEAVASLIIDNLDDLESDYMEHGSSLYKDAVQVYIRITERDSEDAAAAIRQIYSTFGARAALRAALIIKVLRMEIFQGIIPK